MMIEAKTIGGVIKEVPEGCCHAASSPAMVVPKTAKRRKQNEEGALSILLHTQKKINKCTLYGQEHLAVVGSNVTRQQGKYPGKLVGEPFEGCRSQPNSP